MKAIIEAKIAMIDTVVELVNTQSARFYVIPAFEAKFDALKIRHNKVIELLPLANSTTKSFRMARDQKILNVATAAFEVCTPTRAYAASINDDILLNDMKWSLKELKRVKIELIEGVCQTIYDKAYAVRVAATPFNLTADKLTKLETEIPIWQDWVAAVRTRQVAIKVAKQDVVKNVNENEKVLKTQLDFMVESLSTSDPEIVALWYNSRQIIDPPTTNTQSQFVVTNSVTNLPIDLGDLLMVNGALSYTAKTNSLGEATIKPMKPNKYDVTVSAPGYIPYFKREQRVYLGRINRFNIALVPIG